VLTLFNQMYRENFIKFIIKFSYICYRHNLAKFITKIYFICMT